MRYFFPLSLVSLFVIFLAAFKYTGDTVIERPKDVWAIRSVLDNKPRMLSLDLHKNLYIAYNTQTGGLYKAWKGVVNFDGSVFNGVHGFQPSTQGTTLMQEPDESPWRIIVNNKITRPAVTYRGHSIRANRITLKYELQYDGNRILVEERPEYFEETDKIGFEREFKVSGAPENISIALMIHTGSLMSEADLKTNGNFDIDSRSIDEIGNKQYLTLAGMLRLNKDKATLLTLKFTLKPIRQEVEDTLKGDDAIVAMMNKSDCNSCHNPQLQTVGPSYAAIAKKYRNKEEEFTNKLALKIINGGSGNWGDVPMTPHPNMTIREATSITTYILGLRLEDKSPVIKPVRTPKFAPSKTASPGDEAPLQSVHPSFVVSQARPESFKPRVGGMDFLPDGRLVVCTWDSIGAVYILDGVQGNDPEAIKVKRIATGLAEPLGLKVVNNEIYVMQKQELTKLVDLDKDDIIDEYQTVCNGWKASDNFHEFAFGLLYKEGYFYGTLATDINNGGASKQPQVPDRGKVVKISIKDGSFTFIATGLRTPNGIGFGVDNEIFITDNQGDWLPANKLLHLQKGAWYGSRVVDFEGTKNLTETPPVAWMPQDEIANSPSEPTSLNIGPYKNQMLHGDVTHGGIKRVFAEKIDGVYQGAVFRFTQGLEAGINRLVWGRDGALYTGGVGLGSNWMHAGKLKYGLQRLKYNNKSTFEMLAVRAKPNGMEIEFTEPLKENVGTKASEYNIKQWGYNPTANYGGPKMDLEALSIKNVRVSSNRKTVFLEIGSLKPNHVVYIRLDKKTILGASGKELWSTEAWYTLNKIPSK